MDRLKLGFVPIRAWNGLVKNSFVLVIGTGIFSAFYQYYVVGDRGEAVKLAVCGTLTAGVMLMVWNLCDVAWNMRTLRSCAKNYLGNSLANRMRKEVKKQGVLSVAEAEREAAASEAAKDEEVRKARLRDNGASAGFEKNQSSEAYDELLDTMMQRILAQG